ncbi:uncharacterized protein LOC135391435 isoform X2 [Ornithodoros turicata]
MLMVLFGLQLLLCGTEVMASSLDNYLQGLPGQREHAQLRSHAPIDLGPYMGGRIGSHDTIRTRGLGIGMEEEPTRSPSLPRPKQGPLHNMLYPRGGPRIPGSRPTHVRPPRHERCETDFDCLHSPSQICVKHAREPYGRCQCPFYRPVEVSVGGKPRCVKAKDIYDECRTDQECQATQEHLQCVNRLCQCTAPFLLQEDSSCIAPKDMQRTRGSIIVKTTAAILATILVSGTAMLITKKYKKNTTNNIAATGTTSSPIGLPLSGSSQTVHAPAKPQTASKGVHKLIRTPLFSTSKIRNWTHRTRSLVGTIIPTPATRTDESPPTQKNDPLIILWAQKAFRSMASPLYQTNLIQRFKKGNPVQPSAKTSTVDAELHRTLSIEMPVSAEYPSFDGPVTTSSELPFSSMMYGDLTMSKKRPPPPVALGLPFSNRSEDVASFKSYRDSAEGSLEDEMTMRLKQTRRQLSRTFVSDDFSCDDENVRGRKKVTFELD